MLPDPTGLSTEQKIDALYSAVDAFLKVAVPVVQELKPTLDALQSSPWLKMIIGKVK